MRRHFIVWIALCSLSLCADFIIGNNTSLNTWLGVPNAEARKAGCKWKCLYKHQCHNVHRAYFKRYCKPATSRCYFKSVFGKDASGGRTIKRRRVCIRSPKNCIRKRYTRLYRICGKKRRCFESCGSSHPLSGGSGPCEMNKKEERIFKSTNKARGKAKLESFQCNTNLVKAARKWSWQQCKKNKLSHAKMATRIMEAAPNASSLAENISAGNKSAKSTMRYWMKSEAHRQNILTADFTHIGIGYVRCRKGHLRHVWTQMFLQSSN